MTEETGKGLREGKGERGEGRVVLFNICRKNGIRLGSGSGWAWWVRVGLGQLGQYWEGMSTLGCPCPGYCPQESGGAGIVLYSIVLYCIV